MSNFYKFLKLCSFSLGSELSLDYTTATFPVRWAEILMDGKRNLPIRSLNKLLLAYVPGIIMINKNAGWDFHQPWLFCERPIEGYILINLIKYWAATYHPGADTSGLDEAELIWKNKTLNLGHIGKETNGTAKLQDRDAYKILPYAIINRLSGKQLSVSSLYGTRGLTFYRAILPDGEGNELMSEPIEFKEGSFSVVISFTLVTQPWIERPVVNCDFRIRRWVSRPSFLLNKRTSVYLKTDSPWKPGDYSFLVAQVKGGYKRNELSGKDEWIHEWVAGLPPIIETLNFRPLPLVSELLKSNEPYKEMSSLIVFRDGMKPASKIQRGLSPGDRQALLDMIIAQLPELRLVDPPQNVPYKFTGFPSNPLLNILETARSGKDDATDLLNSAQDLVSRRLEGRKITCQIWYQDGDTKEALVSTLNKFLGEKCNLSTAFLNELGTPLQDGKTKKQSLIEKTNERGLLLEKYLSIATEPAIAFIELQGAEEFKPHEDPKTALRWGHSRLGWKTQFLTPKSKKEKDNFNFRVESAVIDGLRQLLLVPPIFSQDKPKQLSLFDTKTSSHGWEFTDRDGCYPLPDEIDLIGVWMLRRNGTGKKNLTGKIEYLPVFVRLPLSMESVREVTAYTYGLSDWIPYVDMGKALSTGEAKGFENENKATGFIQKTISGDILSLAYDRDTILFAHAQNLRRSWPWLANSNIVPDSLTFNGTTPIDVRAQYRGLRVIRVRSRTGSETPEYFAWDGNERIGYSAGLWKLNDRTFFSSTQTTKTNKFNRHSSKLMNWVDAGGRTRPPAANKNVIMPNLLEVTVACCQAEDRAWLWAALTHQLRYLCLNYSDGLQLPLPLYLAKQMEEYSVLIEYVGDEDL